MKTEIQYSFQVSKSDAATNPVCIIGQIQHLKLLSFQQIREKLEPYVTSATWSSAVSGLRPLPTDSCPLWLNNATVAALPTKCSRHNTPSRAHSLTRIVKSCAAGGDEFFVVVCRHSDVFASGCAVARAFPLFNMKSSSRNNPGTRRVTVEFIVVPDSGPALTQADMTTLSSAAHGIRLSAMIVDSPCDDMHTDAFIKEIKTVGQELGIEPFIIQGDELLDIGMGGIHGVGRAAAHAPALVCLSHRPPGATKNVAWVGKGIVFDTGGLCLKPKTSMIGMKRDCGGAAGILGAFYAAVKVGFSENLHAIFCLAENAVGPLSIRVDDILLMYSGRTVEVNNTDAEGRLVLGDGVAFAAKDLKCDVILDMATLTGAQGVATGRYHGSVVTNRHQWEEAAVRAGQHSGDLAFPMPFCPELHYSEFSSSLADMKNSVADRSNAQVSCAGLFIFSHLGFDFPGAWVHVDMASPVVSGERATGYGVALLLSLFGDYVNSRLVNSGHAIPAATDDEDMVDDVKRQRIGEDE